MLGRWVGVQFTGACGMVSHLLQACPSLFAFCIPHKKKVIDITTRTHLFLPTVELNQQALLT